MNYIKPVKHLPAVSPIGQALWPFLTVPNKKWKPEYGEYSVKLLLTPGKEVSAFIAKLESVRDEFYVTVESKMDPVALKKKPLRRKAVYSDNYGADGTETGLLEITFQTMAGGKKKDGEEWETDLRIYDSQAKLITGKINIGNGSMLQINYTPTGYKMTGDESTKIGCKCYLNVVMIHKLVEYSGGDPGFEAVDGGFKYEDGAEVNPDFKPGDGTNGQPDF